MCSCHLDGEASRAAPRPEVGSHPAGAAAQSRKCSRAEEVTGLLSGDLAWSPVPRTRTSGGPQAAPVLPHGAWLSPLAALPRHSCSCLSVMRFAETCFPSPHQRGGSCAVAHSFWNLLEGRRSARADCPSEPRRAASAPCASRVLPAVRRAAPGPSCRSLTRREAVRAPGASSPPAGARTSQLRAVSPFAVSRAVPSPCGALGSPCP